MRLLEAAWRMAARTSGLPSRLRENGALRSDDRMPPSLSSMLSSSFSEGFGEHIGIVSKLEPTCIGKWILLSLSCTHHLPPRDPPSKCWTE
eukprot:5351142-Prymnesium_polylepis.1